jgi:hypothetical protein
MGASGSKAELPPITHDKDGKQLGRYLCSPFLCFFGHLFLALHARSRGKLWDSPQSVALHVHSCGKRVRETARCSPTRCTS